jgi:3-methyladenine DNA glycosylase AlkD
MAAYMKGIAPFLGIGAPERRGALRAAWRDAPPPTSAQVGEAAMLLMKEREREFHYAAYDIIDWNVRRADDYFLATYVTDLLTTKPWWDTVDGLVNAAVSPLCRRFEASWLIDEWSESGDIWLVRAAIGHQRGWKRDTDVPRVLQLCDRHWGNSEFFVAKAIGWALRDLVRIDPDAVRRFLASRKAPNSVAEREARRGLDRLP